MCEIIRTHFFKVSRRDVEFEMFNIVKSNKLEKCRSETKKY